MSREPKYKAWIEWYDDEQQKRVGKMIQAEYRTFKRDAGFVVSDDMIQHLDVATSKATITWLQSTGLKDVRDTDIWEGDVVAFQDCSRHVVRWYDGAFVVGDMNAWFGQTMAGTSKILGNVHEHPELLAAAVE